MAQCFHKAAGFQSGGTLKIQDQPGRTGKKGAFPLENVFRALPTVGDAVSEDQDALLGRLRQPEVRAKGTHQPGCPRRCLGLLRELGQVNIHGQTLLSVV